MNHICRMWNNFWGEFLILIFCDIILANCYMVYLINFTFFQVINGVKETLCGGRRSHSIGDGTGGRNGHWRFSKDSSSNGTKKSHLDLSPGTSVNLVAAGPTETVPAESVPSRYGPRSKTMYTVSKQQVSGGVTQNSFNGRYY